MVYAFPMDNFHHYFIQDPAAGTLRLTAKGLEHFREKFAKIGVDVRKIRTIEQFRDAYERWWGSEFTVAAINNRNPAIDALFADFPAYNAGVRLRD